MVETATECGVTWWVTMQPGGNPLLVASANELQMKSKRCSTSARTALAYKDGGAEHLQRWLSNICASHMLMLNRDWRGAGAHRLKFVVQPKLYSCTVYFT